MSKNLIYMNDSDIYLCNILCTSFRTQPITHGFFSVKKIVSEINPLKTLEKKVVRFTKQNDHRFERVWKQQWTRSSEDEGEKFHGSFGGNVHFLEKKKTQATNCDNWDDGMFFNVPKQFSRKKHTTVHPQAAILGGFVVFLACFSVEKFTKCLHENLWSSDKLHQATCTAVHGLRMVDHLNSWPKPIKRFALEVEGHQFWYVGISRCCFHPRLAPCFFQFIPTSKGKIHRKGGKCP